MKRYLYSLLFVLGASTVGFSQTAPARFNYQAVARNQDGSFMANINNISVGISILDGENGSPVYTETHTGVSTNKYGLFNLQIGAKGTMAVDWSSGAKWIAITINNNPIGKAELLSVPYALYANSSGSTSTGTSNTILNGKGLIYNISMR